jgi:hypothetical protein
MKYLHESEQDSKTRWLEIREKLLKSEARQLKLRLAEKEAELKNVIIEKNFWMAILQLAVLVLFVLLAVVWFVFV